MNGFEDLIAVQLESQRDFYLRKIKETELDIHEMSISKETLSEQMKVEQIELQNNKDVKLGQVAETGREFQIIKGAYEKLVSEKLCQNNAITELTKKREDIERQKAECQNQKNNVLVEIKEEIRQVITQVCSFLIMKKQIKDMESHFQCQNKLKDRKTDGSQFFVMDVGEKKPNDKKRNSKKG